MNRENQFFEIGVQGRKTGISVPHQELDAFGLENPDGFFSPSPEKASQPLDAFMTRTQRGSDAAAAVGAPAPAGRGIGEGAMSGSGEESMDIDSGVDATKSILLPPRARPPFKSSIHMTTNSPNPILSTPRRPASIGPTSSGFTPVNLTTGNISPTRPSSSSAATAPATQINRVLFNSNAGVALQNPVITSQPRAGQRRLAKQLKRKELTVFSSPVGPEVGRGAVTGRQRSESIGEEEEEEGWETLGGKVNGTGNEGGKATSKVLDMKKPVVKMAMEMAAQDTTAPPEKPVTKSKTAIEKDATKSKPAPVLKPSAAQAKKKLLSSRLSIIPTKPPPLFSLSDGEVEQVMRLAAVGRSMRAQEVLEEVSIIEVGDDEDVGDVVGVSGKKWKASEKEKGKEKVQSRSQSQAQIKAAEKAAEKERKKAEQVKSGKGIGKVQGKGKGRARVSDVAEEPEEDQVVENEGEVEEEAEDGGDEAPPTPQPTKNNKKLAQAPVAGPVKGRTSKAKTVLETVPVQTKSKATTKGRKAKTVRVGEETQEEEEQQADEAIKEIAEVEPEPTPLKKKFSKKAAAAEAKAAKEDAEMRKAVEEAAAAKPAKLAEKKKRGKKVPEPEPELGEVEKMEVDQDEEVPIPQPAKRVWGANSAAAPLSSSATAPANSIAARRRKAAEPELEPELVEEEPETPVSVRGKKGSKGKKAAEPETVMDEKPETPVPVHGKKGNRSKKAATAVEEPAPTATKKAGRGGKKPVEPAPEPEVSEEEPEPESELAATKKARRGKKAAEPELEELTPSKGTRAKTQGKGKFKAAPADASLTAVSPVPSKSTKAAKATTAKTTAKNSKGKGKAKAVNNDEDTEMLDAEDPAASQFVQEANNNSYYSEEEADVSPPTKKNRKSKTTTAPSSSPPKASSSKQPSSSKPTKSTEPTKSSQPCPRSVTPDLQQARPPQQRIHIIRLVAPVISPSDANKRRSGRARTAPLNFWTGEKVVTKIEEREDGQGREVVKEVVRVEEAAVSRYKKPVARGRSNSTAPAPSEDKTKFKSKSKSVAGQKRKRGANKLATVPEDGEPAPESSESSEEDGESDLESWELSTGSYSGLIKSRDGSGQLVESIIAYAPDSMTTNAVAGATFRMNKTVSLDHLGTGIIDIPPGGIKRWKPSGKYDLVFYVVKGKVGVMVGENGFMCRKGGQFQVARGEYCDDFFGEWVFFPWGFWIILGGRLGLGVKCVEMASVLPYSPPSLFLPSFPPIPPFLPLSPSIFAVLSLPRPRTRLRSRSRQLRPTSDSP
ncbi:hypothetical protein BGX38DRAFT_1295049 [Terfezia claveryi]|nr:hypothetical protein BGX38DRAFT_1295049 [Terfezia claveryi]